MVCVAAEGVVSLLAAEGVITFTADEEVLIAGSKEVVVSLFAVDVIGAWVAVDAIVAAGPDGEGLISRGEERDACGGTGRRGAGIDLLEEVLCDQGWRGCC